MIDTLKNGGPVSDDQFDRIYSEAVRARSSLHWSPISVAKKAAKLLVEDSSSRVLDVGCGPGKFCQIGALTTAGTFVGVERNKNLVDEATRITGVNNIPRVSFIWGFMDDLDWSDFDAFYFFNPFFESLLDINGVEHIERQPRGSGSFDHDVQVVRSKLMEMPNGTRVATYHGLGGDMPEGYIRVSREKICSGFLCLWIKSELNLLMKRKLGRPA